MALHEESILDPRFGDYVNHDFAEYHIATNADVGTVDVTWINEDDPYVNPMGAKGIGEIGIVGTAAASRMPSITRPASVSATCQSRSTSSCRETQCFAAVL